MAPTVDSINGAVWIFFLAWAAQFVAWRNKYYRLPPFADFFFPPRYTLVAFIIYLASTVTIAPLLYLAINYFAGGHFSWPHLPLASQTLLQILFLSSLLLSFILYLYFLPKEIVSYLFSGNPEGKIFARFWPNLGLGACTWLLSYPLLLFLGMVINALIEHFFGKQEVHQIAVDQLKRVSDRPLLFSVLSFFIVFVVPFLEELLFRGFLQTYLRQRWGSVKALFMTALLFAFFHFSKRQSLGNIELIFSLFLLGSYLGFLYERQRNLWAPIGLHLTFNALSILGILVAQNKEILDFLHNS